MYENVQTQSLLTPNQLFEAMQDSDSENENQETEIETNSENSVVSIDYVYKNPTQIHSHPQIKVENDVENRENSAETIIPNSQNSVVSVDYVLNPTLIKVEKDIKAEKNNDDENHENSQLFGIFECRICEREFENEVELIHHNDVKHLFTLLMNSVHEGGKTKSEKIGQAVHQSDHFFECENCNQRFTTKSKLNFHNCHLQLTVHESQKTTNVSSPQMSQQQPKFLCDICEEPFGFSFLLRDHVKSIHDY